MKEKVPFGLLNYWRMYKSKGIKLPIYYFFEAHLFDILYGTDTHKWLPKEYLDSENSATDDSSIYMASWTNEVKRIFRSLNDSMGDQFEKYTFIDVGCGKGKVGIIWESCCRSHGRKQDIFGLDLVEELIPIAESNHKKIFGSRGKYLVQDASKINPEQFGNRFILYLYNPFNENILSKMIGRFTSYETIVVYNNPVHGDFLLSKGYSIILSNNGFHGNLHTNVYRRNI